MANTLDILRTRLRAAGTTGISDTLGYQIISIIQRTLNARFGRVVSSSTVTLDAYTSIFDIRTKVNANATNLISIRHVNRQLHRLNNWRELAEYDRTWYLKTGTQHEAWAQIGCDLFAVYPATTSDKSTTIYYAALTTEINDSTDDIEMPTEDEDLLYTLCEIVFHLHMRNYPELENRMEYVQYLMDRQYPGTISPKKGTDDQNRTK